jgi:hypothetical protein
MDMIRTRLFVKHGARHRARRGLPKKAKFLIPVPLTSEHSAVTGRDDFAVRGETGNISVGLPIFSTDCSIDLALRWHAASSITRNPYRRAISMTAARSQGIPT